VKSNQRKLEEMMFCIMISKYFLSWKRESFPVRREGEIQPREGKRRGEDLIQRKKLELFPA